MSEKNGEKTQLYPAVFHQRVIVKKAIFREVELEKALEDFEIVEPLAPARKSAGANYCSFSFSVRLQSQDEFIRLDSAIRGVEGFVMML